MVNPDQKTILYDEVFKKLNQICIDFQENSRATDMEVKKLLKDLYMEWGKK